MSKQQLVIPFSIPSDLEFFGKVLEKYGIDFKVEARRDYKSAMASLTDSGWNEKTRQNLEDLLVNSPHSIHLHYSGPFKPKPFTIYISVSSAKIESQQD